MQEGYFVTPEFVKVHASVFDVFDVTECADKCEYFTEFLELSFSQHTAMVVKVFKEHALVESFLCITLFVCQQMDVRWVCTLVLENMRYFFF